MPVTNKKRPYSGTAHRRVLLYRLSGRPTGRQIARGLGIPFGTCYFFQNAVPGEVVIRWGGAELPNLDTARTINKSEAIKAASSKIATFRRLADAGVCIPRWTTKREEAAGWETTVFGRTSEGFAGRGIKVYTGDKSLGNHQLYTEFVPNEREYRLHVVGGEVVSVQRKYLERPHLVGDGYLKNTAHGYVFKTPERGLNTSRKEAAVQAVSALGLDFGAVDLIIDAEGKEYVLEVNTAPSLSPMRVDQYLNALRPLLAARA